MNTKTFAILAAALLLALGMTAMSQAQGRPEPPRPSVDARDAGPDAGPGLGVGDEEMPPPPPGMGQGRGRARDRMRPGGQGHGMKGEARMFEQLGLTDEQRQKLRDLRTAMKNTTRAKRMQLISLEDEKKTVLSSGNLDMAKMEKIDEEIVKVTADILRARHKARRDGLAILTPDQLKRFGDGMVGPDHGLDAGPGPGGRMRGKRGQPGDE
jgi:Spy/CpxP family protein refolding chaperone